MMFFYILKHEFFFDANCTIMVFFHNNDYHKQRWKKNLSIG